MTDNFKTALNGIRAEEKLKNSTKEFLQRKIQARDKNRNSITPKQFAVAFVSVIAILFSGVFTYNLYFFPMAYVDVDVNPSVEIILNRFDRVIDASAYNADGEKILGKANIKYKNYSDAINVLVGAMIENGFAQEDSLISVTLQSEAGEKENAMLSNIESALLEHHGTTQIETFTVDGHVRNAAHELNLSPAKYLAIQELIGADPTATIESCREHSIDEIRQLTEEHSGNHRHGEGHH